MAPLAYHETIRTLDIAVPVVPGVMSERMIRVMSRNRYETGEVRTLQRVLRKGDSVLELGGGVGVVSTAAARIVGAENVTVVEANPDLAPVIAETHRLNGVAGVSVISGLGVPVDAQGTAPFYVREDFWASSLEPPAKPEQATEIAVAKVDLNALLRERHPSVLVLDIEGAEIGLLPALDLSSCRMILLELHPRVYGTRGVDTIFAALRRAGFAYDAKNSRGGTVVAFTRMRAAAVSTPRVTAITCMKNEGPFILEWLAYHRSIGVTDFLVFTNDCTDGTLPLLDRLDELGYVRHLPNLSSTIDNPRHQPWALAYAPFHREVRAADWIISMDVDEFINVKLGDGTLGALFSRLGDAHAISLVHLDFGASGTERFSDILLTETMRQCDVVSPDGRSRRGVKTLIHRSAPGYRLSNHRPVFDDPADSGLRWYDGSGKTVGPRFIAGKHKGLDARGRYKLAQINHYPVRSVDSFLSKSRKGNVVAIDSFVGIDYWRKRNKTAEEETSILARLPAAKRELAAIMAEPGIADLHAAAVACHLEEIASLRQDPEILPLLAAINEDLARA